MSLFRSCKIVAGPVTAMIIVFGAYLWSIQAQGNFDTVVAGEVYRSNQVTPDRLAAYRDAYGIRSVLNLRGASPGEDWYAREAEAARALGLELIDFRLSAQETLTNDQVDTLMRLMAAAPKPLLIHCRSGADRTGLAAGIYQALIAGIGEDQAERQLSIRYGHISLPWLSQAWPMDRTWERIEDERGLET